MFKKKPFYLWCLTAAAALAVLAWHIYPRDMADLMVIPEDISVIGYDGIPMAGFMTPKLTTVGQDRESIARRSVEILLDSIQEKKKAVHEVTPFVLMEGESVRKI